MNQILHNNPIFRKGQKFLMHREWSRGNKYRKKSTNCAPAFRPWLAVQTRWVRSWITFRRTWTPCRRSWSDGSRKTSSMHLSWNGNAGECLRKNHKKNYKRQKFLIFGHKRQKFFIFGQIAKQFWLMEWWCLFVGLMSTFCCVTCET